MTTRRRLPFALLAAVLAAAVVALGPRRAAGDGDTSDKRPSEWPFGGGGTGPTAPKKDLYNLGILGAKASDADRAAPAEGAGGGMRSAQLKSDPSADRGPDRLRIDLLYPDGPAQKAGLVPGDVVVGAGTKSFKDGKDGSLEPLAKAILAGEAGSTKGVTLLVERGGKPPAAPVVVQVPVLGKEALAPTKGKSRAAQVDAALKWLAQKQAADGGYAETLSGRNGAVVQAAIAGLAWLAAGSDLAKGPYADNVKRAVEFVKANVGSESSSEPAPSGGANWNQTNWGYAHTAVFLGELQQRSPDAGVLEELRACADKIAKNQETSGGWAHGPGGPNALGYVELNIVSGLAMLGMGLAHEAGWPVPDDVLAKGRKYIEESSGGDGGVGYSTNKGQQGQGNIGRTAVTWMGYSALGLRSEKWTARMAGYVTHHAGDVFGGHASLMQHFLFAGLASQALGGDAEKAYWDVAETNLVLARAPDGSFQPRPWHESLQMGSNSDVSFGEVWTTACWTLVLCADGKADGFPGLPASTGKLPPKPAPHK
jgi:hypothetical protein